MTAGRGGRPPPWTTPADELATLAAALAHGDEITSGGAGDSPISDGDVLDRLRADIAALLDVPPSDVAVAPVRTDEPTDPAIATVVGHPGALAERLTGRIGTTTPLAVDAPRATSAVVVASDDEATLVLDAGSVPGVEAGALLRAFVGAPVGAWPAASLADPMAARDRAWSEGLAGPLADAVVVSGRRLAPSDGARLVHATGPLDRFRTSSDVVIEDGGWRLRPSGPVTPVGDVPFVAVAPSTSIARGIRADRVLGDALASGPEAPSVPRLIEEWWTAAAALGASGPDGRMPYDLRPRDFVIDAAGAWHHMGGRIRHRVVVPDEASLVRGLVDLSRTTLRRRWIEGLDPTATVGEVVARLARHTGATLGPVSWHLWATIDASASERADVAPAPHGSMRDARLAILERRIGSFWTGLPLPERVRAAVDLSGARRARDIARAHESLRVEILEAARGRSLGGRR